MNWHPTALRTTVIASSPTGAALVFAADPSDASISSYSRFGDDVWVLDISTPGQSDSAGKFDWRFNVSGGLRFTDVAFVGLRDTFKRFVWSLMGDRQNGIALTAGSTRKILIGVKTLVRWMYANGYQSLCELTSSVSEEFLEDVQEECLAKLCRDDGPADDRDSSGDLGADPTQARDQDISAGALRPRLQVWGHLWDQRNVMLRCGGDALPEKPFSGRSSRSLADAIGTKLGGWIPPIPDEVALPIMVKARRWVMEYSRDILKLQGMYVAEYDRAPELCHAYRVRLARDVLTKFLFANDAVVGQPWRGRISKGARTTLFDSKWRTSKIEPQQVFRTLVEDLCAACVIVIQGEAGLRINEICGLKTSIDKRDGLAGNTEVRRSKTGLNENFFLRGLLCKVQRIPREAEWLLGSRPCGSRDVPAPAHAAWVLERLFEPLRVRTVDPELRQSLILCFTAPRGYPHDGVHVARPIGSKLRQMQRQFVCNNVDLAGLVDKNKLGQNLAKYRDTRGACLRTHSWRKTFAQFVFRTDPRMTPAIAQQFHHLSLAMTEEGYLGNDPTLLEVLDSARYEQTARVFYELACGERPLAGRMAKLVEKYRGELAQFVANKSRTDGLGAVKQWVVKEDLRIWFSAHGKCFMRLAPTKARCHQLGDSVHWSNTGPNFAYRTPDVCLGCPMYAVDAEHESFWRARYIENARWLVSASPAAGPRKVAELRARQSLAVLRAIGAAIPDVGHLHVPS